MRRSSSRVRRNGRIRYKKPWAKWFVNLLVLLLLAAAVMAGMAYVPPYWRSWKAQTAVEDVTSQTYSRRSNNESWHKVLADIRAKIRRKLVSVLGEEKVQRSLKISVKKEKDSRWIRVHVTWDDIVEFPLIHEKRILHFSVQAKAATR